MNYKKKKDLFFSKFKTPVKIHKATPSSHKPIPPSNNLGRQYIAKGQNKICPTKCGQYKSSKS